MEIHLIWAQDHKGGIGKNGKLPWHIPEDLKNFKKLTSNCTIIMGRKTWDSLPIKPLTNRRNIILTHKNINRHECYTSINQCIYILKNDGIKKLFVIGGSSIYSSFFHLADFLHITFIEEIINGIDVYFPITMHQIKNNYEKINEQRIASNAIYSYWIKR